jgi:hypothetical protein
MQGNQAIAQLESKLVQTQTTLQVQTNAYQRAQSVERLVRPLAEESERQIIDQMLADHPHR